MKKIKLDEKEVKEILKLSPLYRQLSSDDLKKNVAIICKDYQNKTEVVAC